MSLVIPRHGAARRRIALTFGVQCAKSRGPTSPHGTSHGTSHVLGQSRPARPGSVPRAAALQLALLAAWRRCNTVKYRRQEMPSARRPGRAGCLAACKDHVRVRAHNGHHEQVNQPRVPKTSCLHAECPILFCLTFKYTTQKCLHV